MNAEFRKMTRGFHQNIMRGPSSSLQEIVSEALLCIEPEDVPSLKAYLDELLSGRHTQRELAEIWENTLADIHFHDDETLMQVLRLLRSTIDTHPYLNRPSKPGDGK